MSFKVFCDVQVDGKKCSQEMSPKINKKTGDLYCECGKGKLVNQQCLTEFAKKNLISMGQVHNANIEKKPFTVKCDACDYRDTPELDKPNNKLKCSSCKAELNVTDFFKKAVFEKLK